MTVTVLHLSPAEHDDFVRRHPNGHLMQTTAWARLKEPTGWTWQTVGVGRRAPGGEPEVTGVALVLFRKTPILPLSLAYAPRGFVLDWADGQTLDALIAETRRVARARRGALLRLDPAVPVTDPHLRESLESSGFTRTDPGPDPARTLAQPALRMVTDISNPEELFTQLSSGTRWSVRKASRSGLVYEAAGRDMISVFYDLMKVTGERDGFGIRSLDYFTRLYDLLSPSDEIIVSLVRLDPALAVASAQKLAQESQAQLTKLLAKPDSDKKARQVESLETSIANAEKVIAEFSALQERDPRGPYVAGSVFAMNGTRGSYLYAASSDEHRNLRPNYFMVWTLMQNAHERGVTSFDFGGIDASEGLEEFKRQWEPERVEYAGEFSMRLRPVSSRLLDLAVTLYKRR